MIDLIFDNHQFFASSHKAQRPLPAFDEANEGAVLHGPFVEFLPAASSDNSGHTFVNFDSGRFSNEIDTPTELIPHPTLPLLNTSERFGSGPQTYVKFNRFAPLTVPFLSTARFRRRTAVGCPTDRLAA